MIWYRRELPFTIHDAVSATIPIHAPFIPFNLSTGLLDQINERKPVLYEDSKGGASQAEALLATYTRGGRLRLGYGIAASYHSPFTTRCPLQYPFTRHVIVW